MKTMSSCSFEHDPALDTAFYEAIKEAEKLPNDESQTVQGVNPVQEPDKDRGAGLDAPGVPLPPPPWPCPRRWRLRPERIERPCCFVCSQPNQQAIPLSKPSSLVS